jgi:hypothetical protein
MAGATGAGIFFVGAAMMPDARVEWFVAAFVATFAVIGLRSHGWRELGESALGELVLWAVGAGLYYLWRVTAGWLRG